MSVADLWDIRLPDGRAVRGLDTATVIGYIRAGKIPQGTLIRRRGEAEWTTLEWVPEFAGPLAENGQRTPSPAGPGTTATGKHRSVRTGRRKKDSGGDLVSVAGRLETAHLGTLGVRTILREVLTALDVTVLPLKVRLMVVLGILGGLLFALPPLFELPAWVIWVQAGLALLLLSFGATALAETVHIELSRNRQAHWREVRRGVLGPTCRLFLAFLFVPGLFIAAVAGLVWLSTWLVTQGANTSSPLGWQISSYIAAGLALLLAVKVVIFGPTTLMLASILVVEECGVGRAIGQWLQLLRDNFSRTLLYNLLATGVVLLLLAVPAALVFLLSWLPLDPRHTPLIVGLQGALAGTLSAVTLGYFAVVQIFLYLNLRFVVPR
jgi:hypothetical protein